MAELVPAGQVTHAGQPIVVSGLVVTEHERVPGGTAPSTTAAISVVGAPASE